MLPATIATSVAPETISKVGRLFNGSATDVLNELLQNARRAGASHVMVTTTGTATDHLVTITDDGHGIANPADVLTLGRSTWSAETRAREDPAGMGVFSLAGRDVIIRSWSRTARQGWMAHIPGAAWEDSRAIAVAADPITRGTAITVRVPAEWTTRLRQDLGAVARFYPIRVSLDGEELPRVDWLADAVRVEEWNGSRIGVFRDCTSLGSLSEPRLNFHGVTIPCALPSVKELDNGHSWVARVEIVDTPSVQLVLPARKEAVQNDGLEALRTAVHGAIFRAISDQPSHRLSFADWSTARDLSIDLPEAEPYLSAWVARRADQHAYYGIADRVSQPDMVVMPEFEPLFAQPAALALRADPLPHGPLAEAQSGFAGYAWYDALARIEQIDFAVEQDGRTFVLSDEASAPIDLTEGYVDAITMTIALNRANTVVQVNRSADVAFGGEQWSRDPVDDVAIYIRRGATVTPMHVVDLFEAATFDASDDIDADTAETQRDRFLDDAREHVIRLTEGNDAALEMRVRAMLDDYRWFMPEDRTVNVMLTRERVSVEIADRQPEAA